MRFKLVWCYFRLEDSENTIIFDKNEKTIAKNGVTELHHYFWFVVVHDMLRMETMKLLV